MRWMAILLAVASCRGSPQGQPYQHLTHLTCARQVISSNSCVCVGNVPVAVANDLAEECVYLDETDAGWVP